MTMAIFYDTSRNSREQAGDVVEFEALAAADGQLLVVVFPWGEDEELSSGTGFHSCATGFCQVGETVLLQVDEREPLVECGPHDGFLARRYGGRHKYGSMSGLCQEVCDLLLDFGFTQAA